MQKRWAVYLILFLLLVSCTSTSAPAHPTVATTATADSNSGTRDAGDSSDTGNTIIADNNTSTISFTLSGAVTGLYTINSNPTLSKLRHGHKEFTIDLTDHQQSIFLAFYGYKGPGSYTLTNTVNGGDIRLDISQGSWDLALQPQASCSLTILSETPTHEAGLHKMTGSFSCPLLPPSSPAKPPITIHNGQFDIFIIIES
jgi:hypothetical protein